MSGPVIVDTGGANIASLQIALERLGRSAELTSDPAKIARGSHVILPGVGAAADAMERLGRAGLTEVIPQPQAAGARDLPRHAAAVRGQR